jgi:fucose permease
MKTKNMNIETATTILSSYFGVLLGTRFLCAVFMTTQLEKIVLLLSLSIPPIVLFLVLRELIDPWFLLAIGLFGPFFPVFLARVSRSSPTNWRSFTIWSIVAMNLLLAAGHLFLGKLADKFGIGSAYFLPVAALGLAFVILCLYFIKERRLLSPSQR